MAEGHGGSAQTLRDYWSDHGHAGPSHGAERDAIAWGTPGDFDRCVAQVTAHGHMTEEQAKGYCNLRHHDALGYYPATHARMEKMEDDDEEITEIHVEGEGDTDHDGDGLFDADGDGDGAVATRVRRRKKVTKAADGSGEARVPQGSVTGGQFTAGSDGPSTKPKKPNPYARPKKKQTGPGQQRGKGGQAQGKPKGKQSRAAGIRARIAQLRGQLGSLQKEEAALKAKLPKQQTSSTASSTSSGSSTASSSGSSGASSGSSSSSSSTSVASQLAQVQAKIKQIKAEIAQQEAQLQAAKSARNPRDNPTGRFRTFEGESREASHAFAEGRIGDAVDLLGSARALATEPGHRTMLGQLQQSLARVRHVIPEVTK